MVSSNVKNIVFSSTAAIFGEPKYIPIDEKHSKAPLSPYGRTKLAIEHMLGDYEAAYGIRSIVLRYFNAAGCDPDAKIGERHMPETHLIPIVLQVASGRRKDVSIYGTDYHTPDGTCIRDYIHVLDLCEAHILSLNWLLSGGISKCYNLGNGSGFSVKEVIDAVVKVTGKSVQTIDAEKRSGDPEVLVSDSLLIQQELGWVPKYSSLETLVDHAWRWEIQENRKNQ
jgi:UDP-glucose 4-epimerase